MRISSRSVLKFTVPFLLLLLSGCSTECSRGVPTFVIAPGSMTLAVGQRQGFDLNLIDNSGTHPVTATWSVSPAAGATIDPYGYFVATKTGHYLITAHEESHDAEAAVDVVTTESVAASSGPEAKAVQAKPAVSLFNNWNGLAVHGGGRSPSVTVTTSVEVTLISDYHWNDAHGKTPGTISLKAADGTVYGPYSTTGVDGQGGVKNAQWDAHPDVVIPAGTYTVIDSDPASWAQDGATKGLGFVMMNGIPQ